MTDWTPPEPTPPAAAGWAAVPSPPGWAPYAAPPPPKPGVIPLRPLGVGELLDGSFTTIRRYPRATLGLAAIVMFVAQSVQVLLSYFLLNGLRADTSTAPDGSISTGQLGDIVARLSAFSLVTILVTLLAVLLLTGMVTAVVGDAVLGRPASAGDAWARLRPQFARLLGTSLLTFAIVVVIMVVGVGPGLLVAAAGSTGAGAGLAVVGGLAAAIIAVYVWVALSLAPAAVVLERQGVRAALRRSRGLVRGSWWRVFLILVLSWIIASAVSGIISVPFSLLANGSVLFSSSGDEPATLSFSSLLLSGLGGLIAGTVVRPFSAGVVALLYVDRRMRSEALDVTLRQASGTGGV